VSPPRRPPDTEREAASTYVRNYVEALRAWSEAGDLDPGFADDLELVGARDRPPEDPWGS
jgi:hypothetical protein